MIGILSAIQTSKNKTPATFSLASRRINRLYAEQY